MSNLDGSPRPEIDGPQQSAPDDLPEPGLTMDVEEFRRLGYHAVDLAARYLAGLPSRAVFQPMQPEERRAILEQQLDEEGASPETLLAFVDQEIFTHPMGNGHPRFFGWVNSPPAPIGVLAELLAASLDPSCAGGDHAAIYLERAVIRQLMELIGFPIEGSMGLLVSGGSMASLTGLAAARHRALEKLGRNVRSDGLQGQDRPLVLYLSQEGHSTMRKAAELLGLGAAGVRTIPVDGEYRMDVAVLRAAIAADRAAGRHPFCIAASAGTVSTGAVDPLEQLADLGVKEDLWVHVDGAYGAVGILDPAVAQQYAGLDRVDSLALDPHKWLSVPVECGCAFVRDGALLRRAFSLVPPYLWTEEGKGFGGLPWYSEYGFQQTRGFRALKLWMTLHQMGKSGVRALVQRQNLLARHLAVLVEAAPDFELMASPNLSIVCFRYVPESLRGDDARLDALNKEIMAEVQAGGAAFITNAVLGDRFVLRACVLNYQTTVDDIAALLDAVRGIGSAR